MNGKSLQVQRQTYYPYNEITCGVNTMEKKKELSSFYVPRFQYMDRFHKLACD